MLDILHQLLIFIAVYIGETFGVMFGGGGFFVQPALLASGIEAKQAIANDICAAAFSGIAYLMTTKAHSKNIREATTYAAPSVIIGALIGSYALTLIPESIVKWIILGVCTVGFGYVATHFKKKKNLDVSTSIKNWKIVLPIVGLGIGFYDGFIGAGGGIIVIMALSMIVRSDMKSTISMANWISALSLSSAAALYWYKGLLNPGLLMVMIPACILAGITGAKVTAHLSEKTLRNIYCVVVSCLLLYLMSKEILSLI